MSASSLREDKGVAKVRCFCFLQGDKTYSPGRGRQDSYDDLIACFRDRLSRVIHACRRMFEVRDATSSWARWSLSVLQAAMRGKAETSRKRLKAVGQSLICSTSDSFVDLVTPLDCQKLDFREAPCPSLMVRANVTLIGIVQWILRQEGESGD